MQMPAYITPNNFQPQAFQAPRQHQNAGGVPHQRGLLPVQQHMQLQRQAPATPDESADKPLNMFVAFSNFSLEQKSQLADEFSKKIHTSRKEFDQNDEVAKRGFLGQIVYFKIMNFNIKNQPEIAQYFKDLTVEQIANSILSFRKDVAKITSMLIEPDVFTNEDIVDIVSS